MAGVWVRGSAVGHRGRSDPEVDKAAHELGSVEIQDSQIG
jgi:hypothetical protein